MDLDMMKAQWAEYDRKLDTVIRLNHRLLNATRLNRTRSAMQRLMFGLIVELALDAVAIVALGDFIYGHRTMPQFALPAVALDMWLIGSLGSLIRQIVLLGRIDYDGPIAAIQKLVETLRVQRIHFTRWILLAAPLVWTAMLIVGMKAFLGLDAYRLLGSTYLMANFLFGVAFIPIALWLSQRLAEQVRKYPILQRIVSDLSGDSLTRAAAFLATLSAFEEDR
jgi:hypothetical protein